MLGATLFKGENRRQRNLPVGRSRKPPALKLPAVDKAHHVLAREAKPPRRLLGGEQLLLLGDGHSNLFAFAQQLVDLLGNRSCFIVGFPLLLRTLRIDIAVTPTGSLISKAGCAL